MKYPAYIFFCIFICGLISCSDYSPKPSGYYRIDLSPTEYQDTSLFNSFHFSISNQAKIISAKLEEKQGSHFNILYPRLNAEIFCSYFSIKEENILQLSEESRKFVYLHALKADAIQEEKFHNTEQNVYGVVYNINGNIASPIQFVLTDSIKSFFRGALYFNNTPNQDSIAPVLEYIDKDIQVLIESFQWK